MSAEVTNLADQCASKEGPDVVEVPPIWCFDQKPAPSTILVENFRSLLQSQSNEDKLCSGAATSAGSEFLPGQAVGGRYRVISLLGRGGMGLVYRVNQMFLNREFALKTIEKRCLSEIAVRRFQQEARAAFALDHPNIIAVNDFGVLDDQTPFLVMELAKGETLGDLLKRKGCLTLEEAIPIFVQVCFGLAYAHQHGIVHRDIKPSNIMILDQQTDGTERGVKILDFGIAKFIEQEGGEIQALTRTGEIFGSPPYMSPEQCTGERIDHRADIYSLGCVFFEALTGAPPCVGDTALTTMMKHQKEPVLTLKQASLGSEFPQAIEDIVATMLAKSPDNRYQNLGALANDLGALTRGESISAVAATAFALEKKSSKTISMSREKFYACLVGIAVLSGMIVAAIGLGFQSLQISKSASLNRSTSSTNPHALTVPSSESDSMTGTFETIASGQKVSLETHKAAFRRAGAISSSIVTSKGIKQRLFIFPEYPIGRVSNRSLVGTAYGPPKLYESWTALNTVLVPANVPLTLEVGGHVSPSVVEFPAVLKKVDPKEFSELVVGGRSREQLMSAALEDRINETISASESVTTILHTSLSWFNLKSVELAFVPANPSIFTELNKFKHLQKLTFKESLLTTPELAQNQIFRRMKELRFCEMPVENIIIGLAGSSILQTLYLDDTQISPATLQALQRCQHLEAIRLERVVIDRTVLKGLAQIKSLRRLKLAGYRLTPGEKEIFKNTSVEVIEE